MAISRMQEPRQLYGLGSLVKKAVRGVKKIAKSPIGKALIGKNCKEMASVNTPSGEKNFEILDVYNIIRILS